MVMDQKITSSEYLNFTLAQLPLETNEEILVVNFKNLKELIEYYLPIGMVQESNKKVFEMILKQIQDKKMSSDAKYLLAENLHWYLTNPFDVEMAVRWLEKGYIHTGGIACGTPELLLLNSTKALNIQFLKAIFKS